MRLAKRSDKWRERLVLKPNSVSRLTCNELIVQTGKGVVPTLAEADYGWTPETLYQKTFGRNSREDLTAGLFQQAKDVKPEPGLYMGWAMGDGFVSKMIRRLEGGCVNHVFWMWWVG
jgi:hypothetical protein